MHVDIEKFREDLIRQSAGREGPKQDDIDETDDLARLIRTQAEKITARFTEATDTGERNRLRDRYGKLDRWMGELKQIDALPEAERESRRVTLRAIMLEELSKWNLGGAQQRARIDEIETGRKHLVERARAGALTHAHKRLRDEIHYLIKHYTPSNDYKIETLIDKWRTSGDPAYDPGIKMQLRRARRRKGESDYAL
jgi:hypothetical protein